MLERNKLQRIEFHHREHRGKKLYFLCVLCSFLCALCGEIFTEEFTYDSHGKKDPFSPPVISAVEKAGTEVLAGVRIEGIIWDEKKPIAVINDKVVGIGDEISGAKIIDIKQNEVIFDVNGQMISVKLRIPEGGQTSFKEGGL